MSKPTPPRIDVGVLLVTATFCACGGRSAGMSEVDAAVDTDAAHDASQPPQDAAPQTDAQVLPDAGTDWCHCAAGEVYRWHECVATLELGCGPSCEVGVTDCGEYHSCEPCAASSACDVEDCRPGCVNIGPAMGPVADPLRVEPVFGTAGQGHTVTISGFPFYVGALGYHVRLGDEIVAQFLSGNGVCSMVVDLPARPPGMLPLWVSDYGGGDPWALAGFFTYSGGVVNECIQPGFRCAATDTCCATADVAVTCQGGRCLP